MRTTLCRLAIAWIAASPVAGCNSTCRCALCPPTVRIDVTLEPGVFGPVSIDDEVCPLEGRLARCALRAPPGDREVTLRAANAVTTTVRVSVAPASIPGACNGQCSACSPTTTTTATLRAAPSDASVAPDGGALDTGA